MSAEEWRGSPSFPGYFISSHGRIASLHKWRGQDGPRILRTHPNAFGYPIVQLRVDGAPRGRICRSMHVLVAEAFLGPRPAGHEVRHLDGDPLNCRVGNLTYGTHSENERDKIRHGTHASCRAECVNGHSFAGSNLYVDSVTGHRYCRICTAANSRRYRARKRAALQSVA